MPDIKKSDKDKKLGFLGWAFLFLFITIPIIAMLFLFYHSNNEIGWNTLPMFIIVAWFGQFYFSNGETPRNEAVYHFLCLLCIFLIHILTALYFMVF